MFAVCIHYAILCPTPGHMLLAERNLLDSWYLIIWVIRVHTFWVVSFSVLVVLLCALRKATSPSSFLAFRCSTRPSEIRWLDALCDRSLGSTSLARSVAWFGEQALPFGPFGPFGRRRKRQKSPEESVSESAKGSHQVEGLPPPWRRHRWPACCNMRPVRRRSSQKGRRGAATLGTVVV